MVDGDPTPSVIWKTPNGDTLTDPQHGHWLDGTIGTISAAKIYQIYATGEIVHFTVRCAYLAVLENEFFSFIVMTGYLLSGLP